MQRFLPYTFWILSSGLFLLSCNGNGDDDPNGEQTKEQLAIEELTGGNHIVCTVANGGLVSKDDQVVTADYESFELGLIANQNNKTYSSSPNLLFDQMGSWSFAGENFDKIQLTGEMPAAGKEISFTRTQDRLRLMFTVPAPSNARTNALAGTYIFELVKKP